VTNRQIWLTLDGLEVLIALLGFAYWLNTGSQVVLGFVMLAEQGFTCYGTW
jgi:hypothetical protein